MDKGLGEMIVTDLLVLPADVLLVPVEELTAGLGNRVEFNKGDFAISRRRARAPSRVIDRDAAQLLREFRTPKTIVEAIITYSSAKQLNPEEVLDNSFPLLQRLCNSRFLVPFGSYEAELIEPSYEVGSVVGGYEIVRCVQVLEDTEVYQVRSQGGQICAVKCMRPGASTSVAKAFERESAMLAHLDQVYTPALLAQGEIEGKLYLLLEWCDGEMSSISAEKIRRSKNESAALDLINLCHVILKAYAHIHSQNVVHADVHPRNSLVGHTNSVKIIDFGLARFEGSSRDAKESRGGIGFYFEPEYARASLSGEPVPAATKLGEQYALGALLYLLITGMHYLDFSPERDKALKQIIQNEPLPFSRRGTESWPEVEKVLNRALAKNPSERYPTIEEFAHELSLAGTTSTAHSPHRTKAPPHQDRAVGARLVHKVLSRLGTSGNLIWTGLSLAPTASVNYGAAGISYMFYRMACVHNDPRLLSAADLWMNRAKTDSTRSSAFYNSELDVTEKNVDPVSLYHTMSGVNCVEALISHARGDLSSAREALAGFSSASSQHGKKLDLTLGKSGVLVGCATLLEAMPSRMIEEASLAKLGATVLDSIWSEIEDYAPIIECRELPWLGIAHGWAGILFATMKWCQSSRTEISSLAEARLWQLSECAETTGRGVCWSRRAQDDVVWPGWCHGTAGHVYLWILAHRIESNEKFLELAQKSAWHTWKNPQMGNSSLCCGLAGQAYALLSLYKYTGDKVWLTRASEIATIAFSSVESSGLVENSLYKGDVGIALLAAELTHPESSCMPLFESE